ncbi:MAG: sugar transferase [Clostridia bacterium]|nr:sugar transferase [Clostridia bacterium]
MMKNNPKSPKSQGLLARAVKRLFDILLALFLSLLTLPVALVAMLLICIFDSGTPFYTQRRVGIGGREFTLLKLRTMRKNADRVEDFLTAEELALYRHEYKLSEDPRLIGYRREGDGKRCLGALLRRTSIDEIPQLWWNVLICGNMSLVGPRPVLREELDAHYSKEEQEAVLSVKPGVTGYWQAYARNRACYENGERQKMELYYVENRSFWLDIRILFRTVVAVIAKTGAK